MRSRPFHKDETAHCLKKKQSTVVDSRNQFKLKIFFQSLQETELNDQISIFSIENEVEVSILSSRLYLVEDTSTTATSNPIRKFLIRLYGGKLLTEDNPIKPEGGEIRETLVFYAIGLAGLGPKLYGSFNGGRVEEFVSSHVLSDVDYDERPETMLELARKLARFHSLDLPISSERHQILNACEFFHQNSDFEQFRKLANHVDIMDTTNFKNFDVESEIKWLKRAENAVNGRIVTCSGDLNKNNVLILDRPDKFGERVMLIDYEQCARDYRGRNIGQIFITKTLQSDDGYFYISSDYPNDTWRRSFVIEYLKETKFLNYFEWDDKLDSVDHVLMEADFFMFHCVQMFCGIYLSQKDDSLFYKMPVDKTKSILEMGAHLIEVYRNRKAIFTESYGKLLGLSS